MALRTENELRGLSLCAGVGGLDLGLHIAEPNYRTVGYVERQAHAASTLVARMADKALAEAPVWDDLRSFDGRPWRNRVHLVTGGYPCQPFSFSGLRRGADDPRHLWPQIARIVSEVRPRRVFFENVPGHISLGLDSVIGDLQGMGFRVAAGVFSAAETGAGHIRERLFVLGDTDIPIGRESVDLHDRAGGHPAVRCAGERLADRIAATSDCVDVAVAASDRLRLEGDAVPLFAPGPGDLPSWYKALQRRPDLQPCIHGLDHGMADWVDRSGEAGNGVVSLAAALAWRTLNDEFAV